MRSKSIILSFIFVATFLFFNHAVYADNGWWNDGWKYRKQLTFQNSAQTENLVNFPVLVKLTASNFDFSKAQSTGYDIRFLDSDNNTELPYEIEKWDTAAQEAIVWVKVPQINASSNSDYIYIYYGNASAVNAQSTINVWTSSHIGVWHLKENPGGTSPQAKDSSAAANDATALGGMSLTNLVTGKIGSALYFDNSDDRLEIASPKSDIYKFSVNQNFSVSAWIKTATPSTYYWQVVGNQSAFGRVGWYLMIHSPFGNASTYFALGNTCCPGVMGTSRVDDTQWHFLYGVRQGSTAYIYIDGNLETTETNSSFNVPFSSAYPFYIGKDPDNFFGYNGIIDEVRVENTARSTAWVSAEYKSQNNTFISYASEDTYIHSTANTQYVAQSSTEKPTCSNSPPSTTPDLFQINTTKNSATLYFTPAGNPHNSYTISYGYDDNIERFGTGFSKMSSDGVQSYTINALSPSTKYFFKIRASNGCMPGPWSRTMTVKTGYSNSGFIFYAYNSVVKMINSIVH